MPLLTIGGNALDIQDFAELEPLFAGEDARAFNNTLLSSRRNPKRRWRGRTRPMVHTEFATIRSAIMAGTPLSCAGDVFQGATFSCLVRLTEMPYERAKYTTESRGRTLNPVGYEVVYGLEFEEV